MSRGVLPPGGCIAQKITIICSEVQEEFIKQIGCIACNDEICNIDHCDKCLYCPENIEFRRE